ncbi:hypothetical protein [Elizabethkingia meningoseptica]|uniref:hypothetical protein n=1 Tax=Elizabethkingia meningoseptica TaxID=238 RepID=UPI0038923A97
MKKNIIFLVLILSIISCKQEDKGLWTVKNITRDTIFSVKTHRKNIFSLHLKIQGEVDDSIIINGTTKYPAGKINDSLILDRYTDPISISYKAYKAKKGHLRIYYYVP